MANKLQLGREIQAFVVKETTKGTYVHPVATNAIFVAGVPNFNQQPSYTDSEEIRNSRSLIDRFVDQYGEGTWDFPVYARIGAAAGDVPQADVLYECGFGLKTVSSGEYVLYNPAIDLPSFSLLIIHGDVAFAIRGATVNQPKVAVTNKGAVGFAFSGGFMQMMWAGLTEFATGMAWDDATKTLTLPTSPGDDYRLYSEVMRVQIWDDSASAYLTDTGSNAYFEIATVDAVNNKLIFTDGVLGGSWTPLAGDRIEPWAPTASFATTHVLQARDSDLMFDGVLTSNVIPVLNSEIALNNNVKYLTEEKTADGFPSDYVADKRQVNAKTSLFFRKNDLKFFRKGLQRTSTNIYFEGVKDPDAAAPRELAMQMNVPNAIGSVPAISGDLPRQLDIDFTALAASSGSGKENEISLKFGDLTV